MGLGILGLGFILLAFRVCWTLGLLLKAHVLPKETFYNVESTFHVKP